MDVTRQVLELIDETLGLKGRALRFAKDTSLLGSVPELDSMAVASLLTGIEDRFGVVIEDDDVDGSTFETVGSLVSFVESKLNGS